MELLVLSAIFKDFARGLLMSAGFYMAESWCLKRSMGFWMTTISWLITTLLTSGPFRPYAGTVAVTVGSVALSTTEQELRLRTLKKFSLFMWFRIAGT